MVPYRSPSRSSMKFPLICILVDKSGGTEKTCGTSSIHMTDPYGLVVILITEFNQKVLEDLEILDQVVADYIPIELRGSVALTLVNQLFHSSMEVAVFQERALQLNLEDLEAGQ